MLILWLVLVYDLLAVDGITVVAAVAVEVIVAIVVCVIDVVNKEVSTNCGVVTVVALIVIFGVEAV